MSEQEHKIPPNGHTDISTLPPLRVQQDFDSPFTIQQAAQLFLKYPRRQKLAIRCPGLLYGVLLLSARTRGDM